MGLSEKIECKEYYTYKVFAKGILGAILKDTDYIGCLIS